MASDFNIRKQYLEDIYPVGSSAVLIGEKVVEFVKEHSALCQSQWVEVEPCPHKYSRTVKRIK